jgi:hypothetical protein
MNTRIFCALLTLAAPALAAEKPATEQLKEKTAEAVEATKEGARRAADVVTAKSREAWTKTKAYFSDDPATYRDDATKHLKELEAELARIKQQTAGVKDRPYFATQLKALEQHQKFAVAQLAALKGDEVKKTDSKRIRLDKAIERLDEHLDVAQKEASDFTGSN